MEAVGRPEAWRDGDRRDAAGRHRRARRRLPVRQRRDAARRRRCTTPSSTSAARFTTPRPRSTARSRCSPTGDVDWRALAGETIGLDELAEALVRPSAGEARKLVVDPRRSLQRDDGRRSHRQHALPARRRPRALRDARRLAVRQARRRSRARERADRSRRLLRAPALGVGRADDVAAVGRRLPRRLRAAARGRSGHRLDPPLGRGLGHVRLGAAGREQLAERGLGDRIVVLDSRSGAAGPRARRDRRGAQGATTAPGWPRSARTSARRSSSCGSGSASTRSSTCAAAGASAARRPGSAAR